ncbi:hypothetical protein [Hufsiella ginkgonis]|uniref:Uncharacterized protein n=1 Tax=Hufsiella ginkgonis TaxID=2695274 RepID=A0A7K1Y339_9SPHI|nr:hypothetical protein [Hufsiella ginkgonis]MXV17713.1 hypothetical protein [Hufsiella ginkgonis]
MKIVFTLLFFILSVAIARSQTPPGEPPVYSLSVVMKVKDITSVITISETKINALYTFFQKEETAFAHARDTNAPSLQTQALIASLKAEFRTILTPQELKAYSAKRRGAYYAETDSTITRQPGNRR